VTWDDVLNAKLSLVPPKVEYGPLNVPPVPVPGVTRLNRSWGDK
jgi:hypothetical protein